MQAVPLSENQENAIRAAVQSCLDRCYRGNTPLGVLAEYMADLREKDRLRKTGRGLVEATLNSGGRRTRPEATDEDPEE